MKALIFLTAALATGVPGEATKDDTTGSIEGRIMWEGEKPKPKSGITITEDKQTVGCHDHGDMRLADNTLLIGPKGGVANVVLTIEIKDVEVKVPDDPIRIDQKGCRFEPHVQVLPVGATISFMNSDTATHNLHTFPKKNKAKNKNVAGGGNFQQVLDKAETILVKCDIHPWMKSYVVVTKATHYSISDASGGFKIDGLPPGDYELSWWHEELGKGKTEKVTVAVGATTELTQKVGAAKKKKKRRRR